MSPFLGMVSQHQCIWILCRDRRGGGRYQNQSWPDDTCFDVCLLPFETGPVSGYSECGEKWQQKKTSNKTDPVSVFDQITQEHDFKV